MWVFKEQFYVYILLQYLQTFKCGLLLVLSRVSDRKGCFYETGRFFVAVNPFVANAILGKPLGGYRPLIDAAIFQLKGTVAIVLSWLSAWLLPGKAGKISLDMLEEHIYGDRSKDRKVRYWRRRKLRKALEEIGKLSNWQITEVRKGIYELKREEKKA